MTKASDNPFPSILIVETAAPTAPAAGNQRAFIDPADHKLKRIDSSGAVTTVEGGGTGGGTSNRITASLASTFSSTTGGAWTDITGLSATYTPSVNQRLMLQTRIRASLSATGNLYTRVTVTPTPAAGPGTFDWVREGVTASALMSALMIGSCDLTAGTAYTVKAQFFFTGTGSLSVTSTIEDTELSGVLVPR